MSEQLFICMYNKGDLISLTVSRPTYDRTMIESAVSVINYNIVQKPYQDEFIAKGQNQNFYQSLT